MKTYENCIELSDKRLMWDLHNEHLSDDDLNFIYDVLVADCEREFENIYDRRVIFLGRSGRHVCAENTPQNRQNYCRMKATVARQQKRIVKAYNSARDITDINKYLKTIVLKNEEAETEGQ